MSWFISIIAITLCVLYGIGYIKLRNQGKGIRLLIIPFSLNLIFSCTFFYALLLIGVTIVHQIPIDISLYLLLLIPLVLQTISNLLLYFLYYKKKNKLTNKEFVLTCISGATAVFVYMFWLEIRTLF